MDRTDFTRAFHVAAPADQVFQAINRVSAWWSEDFSGASEQLHDVFEVRFGTVHYSRQELVEVVPNRRIVWLVTDSHLSFLKHTNEWNQTVISFDITPEEDRTRLVFTHKGLVPTMECFRDCSNGWNQYLEQSLLPYINTGQGDPNVLQKEISEKM
ncbi:MAG TPA: SRPBCC domain-containing protein [Flavisolibacter sp.]|jgi:uncharacterized protein YndB with AHSA1/START domain|nr:SRPBCC domain-containing protein [Flavisolibacter sp.]